MAYTKDEKAIKACDILEEIYPESVCALKYEKPYELLIAVRLSAQCTDARVNIVTESLFKKYPTLESFADAELSELEQDVKPCGFYRTKAESIIGMAKRLIEVYDSRIPDTMEELLTLPGVGRKTANLILGDVYGQPAIVTDTHFIRITGRLGLTANKEPEKVERDLRPLIPPERSSDFCHRIVQFGRDTCIARKPKCAECRMQEICAYYGDNFKKL
ncbi:MAG: endonuclease III [Ruminococcus sp.]